MTPPIDDADLPVGPAAADVPAVAHGLAAVPPGPSVVTIGNFDGVHRGHLTLLRRAVGAAAEREVRSVAITFHPHPAAVLRPGTEPLRLQSPEERTASILEAGIDLVVVLPFTRELSSLSPDEFVERVLVERLQAQRVIVGSNFRFGHKAAGDVLTLNDAGEVHGFSVELVTLLELDDRPLSSTSIRDHLAAGDLAWANRALGRPFSLSGRVVPGDGRGRTIGVPTANVEVAPGHAVPGNGVYAGHVLVRAAGGGGTDPAPRPCVTNVGVRPTFEGAGRTVEVHILDTELDLYDRELVVTFEHRLRDEQRFDGIDALVAQIRADIDRARELLGA